jgi:excisionase family DNA binding protein
MPSDPMTLPLPGLQLQPVGLPDQTGTVPRLLLTQREAAQALAVSERTLWQLTHDGAIPAVRIGRAVRYRLEDLRAWVAQQVEAKQSGPAG